MTTIKTRCMGREATAMQDSEILRKFTLALAAALGDCDAVGNKIRTSRFEFEVISRYKVGIVFLLRNGRDTDGEAIHLPNLRQPTHYTKKGAERVSYDADVDIILGFRDHLFYVPFGTHAATAADRIYRDWLPLVESTYGARVDKAHEIRDTSKRNVAHITAFAQALGLQSPTDKVFRFPGVEGFTAVITADDRNIEISGTFSVEKLAAATPAIGALLEALASAAETGDNDGQV